MDSYFEEAKRLVAQMTVEEQALLLSGDGAWRTHAIPRLGVPSIAVSDGPHGLRKMVGGSIEGLPATCFPTAPALAATWDRDLIREVGAALGREAQAADVQIVLGPGINIKRSPLGGRNFEYFSEDPLLAGRLAAAYIEGVQSEGVGTSLKHFAVNSQETFRMSTSSDLDARTLHEIYLPAFEIAVREAQPWTVMSAYNLVNGIHASEHAELLTGILRRAWGFAGFVMSDWGGINDRVAAVAAGNNLEMPGSGAYNRAKIVDAVRAGRLSTEALAQSAAELVSIVLRASAARQPGAGFDPAVHHALARRVGAESIVLLKNEGDVLPLRPGHKIALLGSFARRPRYQGAGSSQVNPIRLTNTFDELAALIGPGLLTYAPGCDEEGETGPELLDEARQAAQAADVAVVFAGLPDSYESEGKERASIDLPPGHVALIETAARAAARVVVVLVNGSTVAMPWLASVSGVLEAWLGGQAGGGAIADVLTGKVNPSGRLAETFPARIEDSPSYPDFPSRSGRAAYGEGVYVGYRHYDRRGLEPLFPFGFGLSYTKFAFTGLRCDRVALNPDDGETVTLEATVKNVGGVAGKEVVQLYVHARTPAHPGPTRQLRAFAKIDLAPGEEKTVSFTLGRRDFAHYDVDRGGWVVAPGLFDAQVGASSRDLPLTATLDVSARPMAPTPSRRALVQDFKPWPGLYAEFVRAIGGGELLEPIDEARLAALGPQAARDIRKARASFLVFIDEMPAAKVPAFSEGRLTDARLDEILALATRGWSGLATRP